MKIHFRPAFKRAMAAFALFCLSSAPAARAADPANSFGSSVPGVTYDTWNNVSGRANAVMNAMNSAGLNVARIGTSYNRNNTNGEMDSYILAVKAHNLTPYLLVEYYGYYGDIANGTGNIYNYWRALGQNIATRYQPNSAWLKSQGISNWGITCYSAINEPDIPIDGQGQPIDLSRGIPLNDYYGAIQGFADGIHAVNSGLKVIPGGFARPNAYGDGTGGGYISKLAPLFNNGTLDGVDLHLYSGGAPSGDYGPMALFRSVKNNSGISADINHYCTEFNYDDNSQTPQKQAEWELSFIWAHLGVGGNGQNGLSNLKSQVELAFDIGTLSSQAKWGLTQSFNPWVPTVPGQTMQFVAQQSAGMHFSDIQPWNYGYYVLDGNNSSKRMWVVENHTGWAWGNPRSSFTCSGIPTGTTQLLVYGWDGFNGPRQTIPVASGTSSVTVNNLGNECYMIVAAPPGFLFYTSFENGQPQPTWNDSVDFKQNVAGFISNIQPECSTRTGEQAQAGNTALLYSGSATASAALCYYKVFSVNIPIAANTRLCYSIYPQQDNGRYVAVDFHCTDGSTLRDSGAVDSNGFSFHPNKGHGGQIPYNAWTKVEGNIGSKLAGKTIDKIWVAFDRPGATIGQYRGYIDEIKIANSSTALSAAATKTAAPSTSSAPAS